MAGVFSYPSTILFEESSHVDRFLLSTADHLVFHVVDYNKVYPLCFQEKAAELLRVYRSSEFANRTVLSFQELCTLSTDVCADESTLCMALLQLQRDKQVLVSLHEGEKVSHKQPLSLETVPSEQATCSSTTVS